jgi:hypothetical protein
MMSPTSGNIFTKTRQCPSSEVLLSYRQRDAAGREALRIACHLNACEFCRAELQLLSKHPASEDSFASLPIPANLRLLAEALLTNRGARITGRLEKAFEAGI